MERTERLDATIEDLELEAGRLARDGSESARRTLRILRAYIDHLHDTAYGGDPGGELRDPSV